MRTIVIFLLIIFLCPALIYSQSWKELNTKTEELTEEGEYRLAIEFGEKALKQAEKEFGKNDSNYAVSLNNLATLYQYTGQYLRAEPLFLEAVKIRKQLNGERHPSYLVLLNNLAGLYDDMGKYDKAEPLYLQDMKTTKEITGDKNEDYAVSLNNLALLYMRMGLYDKAEPLCKESIAIYKEFLQDNKSDMTFSLNNLAYLYEVLGQYEKAEPLFLESLNIRKEVLGEKHPYYAVSLNNLAHLYFSMGQYEKAELIFQDAIKIQKDIYGEKQPEYAGSLNNLAGLYRRTGNYEKAEPLYLEALKIRKEIFGVKHIYYAQALNNLAALYSDMGEYEKALPFILEAKEIVSGIFGEKHPDYAQTINNLAKLYGSLGQYEKAEKFYIEAINVRKDVLGEKHPAYASSLNNLAELYKITEKYDKAEPLFIEANEIYIYRLRNIFPYLSENQKLNFLKSVYDKFEIFYSYSDERCKENPSIISNMLDVRIASKGIILNSTVSMYNKIRTSDNQQYIDRYNELINLKSTFIKAQELSVDERSRRGLNISELERKSEELEKELSISLGTGISEKFNWRDIKSSLEKNEAAVEYIDFNFYDKDWTDSVYYSAVIVRNDAEEPVYIKLCTQTELENYLSDAADNQNSYVRNPEKSIELYRLIWQPVANYLSGIDRVIVSPSGILNKISFSALRDENDRFLIDKYKITYAGNLKDIAINKELKMKDEVMTAAVFGGIVYDIDSVALSSKKSVIRGEKDFEEFKPEGKIIVSETKGYYGWDYLDGTLTEANNIKSILENNEYNVSEYTGLNGSEEIFKSLNGNQSPGILHISTHGFFNPEPDKSYEKSKGFTVPVYIYKLSDNPLFRSGLIFAGANRVWKGGSEIEGLENGILTAYEVSTMDFRNTGLVVLSACETGLGDIKGGEGVFGLQRAFKTAGANNIIMSLWKVPDEATMELMTAFYSNWLVKKMSKDEAFFEAQKQMKQKFSDPYFWSGFIFQ